MTAISLTVDKELVFPFVFWYQSNIRFYLHEKRQLLTKHYKCRSMTCYWKIYRLKSLCPYLSIYVSAYQIVSSFDFYFKPQR